MGSVIDDFDDANGEGVQPYAAAFMIDRGYRTLAEARSMYGNNTEFMVWSLERWAEFSRLFGIPEHRRGHHREEYKRWLNDRCLDRLARDHVEAARPTARQTDPLRVLAPLHGSV